MKFSSNDLVQRILRRNLVSLNSWIAECQSLQSAPSPEKQAWFPRVNTSREAIVVIFLSLFAGLWQTDRIIEHIAQLAYRYRYSGGWRTVQDFLESYDTPARFVEMYLQHRSFDEFFGNFLPSCDRYIRWHHKSFKGETQKGPVLRPQRRRGYNDKGTLRPYYQRGRNLPGEESKQEDRRGFITHPLSKFFEGDRWQTPSS